MASMWIFHETPDSGDQTAGPESAIKRYVCGRTGSDSYVRAYAIAATPVIYDGLFRQHIAVKAQGGGMWRVEVQYGPIEPPKLNEYSIRFDTTGGTARITHAKEHIQSYAPSGKTAPDHKGAINVADDGRVEGTDIVVPQFKWSEDWTLDAAVANWSYAQVLKALTGKVNAGTFRGFTAGHVLFEGATGGASSQSPDKVQLTFNFVHQDSATGITVGDITNIQKVGWQYSWVEYARADDTTANALTSRPLAVHIERVYDTADFGLLLIGN